jgi:beta-N-acetylhexosaminidase
LKLKQVIFGLSLLVSACQDIPVRKEVTMVPPTSKPNLQLRKKIGQMIMVGFKGTKPSDIEVKTLERQAQKGLIGGVIFFAYNLDNPQQVNKLTTSFKQVQTPHPLLLAIDQEGGKVQRLQAKNGFTDFLSAKEVTKRYANTSTDYYAGMAKMVKDAGFNMALGPVVDLEYNPKHQKLNPVIGALERSYGANPHIVSHYASSFITAFHQHGVLTALKHFPGHGYAQKDSHKGMVDVTLTHSPVELEPFYQLIHTDKADAIITGHLVNRNYDPVYPATLSRKTIKPLLRDKGYKGVIISDCLHMGAIQKHFTFDDIIIRAINAGVDILLFSNNNAVSINTTSSDGRIPSPQLVKNIITVIEQAVAEGKISPQRINASYKRIVKMKERMSSSKMKSPTSKVTLETSQNSRYLPVDNQEPHK